jgi:hypothetical protein
VINNQFIKRMREPGMDALGRCFALICLTERERTDEALAAYLDDNYLKEKVDRWSAAGLTRGLMMAEYKNFLKASPDNYLPYLERLMMMEAIMPHIEGQ